jgi:hypothetical protein
MQRSTDSREFTAGMSPKRRPITMFLNLTTTTTTGEYFPHNTQVMK